MNVRTTSSARESTTRSAAARSGAGWVVVTAIARMPPLYRDVYVLADVEGLPNAEIADMLGIGIPAVKSRLHRDRLWMREALAPHFEEASS